MSNKYIYDDNITGPFYVHDSCIACDTCTDIAPKNFKLTSDYDHAIVYNQPDSKETTTGCNQAMDACPVGAIEKH